MSVPPFRGNQVGFGGDWHGQLLVALNIAARCSCVPAVRDAVRELRELLEQIDECQHSVTLCADIPVGAEPEFVLDCVRGLVKEEGGKAELMPPRTIRLELTGRGTLDYVQCLASEKLSRGIGVAQFILRAESSPPFRKKIGCR